MVEVWVVEELALVVQKAPELACWATIVGIDTGKSFNVRVQHVILDDEVLMCSDTPKPLPDMPPFSHAMTWVTLTMMASRPITGASVPLQCWPWEWPWEGPLWLATHFALPHTGP